MLVSAKKQLQLVLAQVCCRLQGVGTQNKQIANSTTTPSAWALLRIPADNEADIRTAIMQPRSERLASL